MGEFESILTDIPALVHCVQVGDVDRIVLSAEWLLRDLLLIEHLLPHQYSSELVDSVSEVVGNMQKEADERKLSGRGRPAIYIPEDQLPMLLEHHFSIADIAHMISVSARTVRRRVLQYDLESSTGYSDLFDSQLVRLQLNLYTTTHTVAELAIKVFCILLAFVCSSRESEKVCSGWMKEEWREDLGKPCIMGITVFVCPTVCGILMATIS